MGKATSSTKTKDSNSSLTMIRGWTAVAGCSLRALAVFRIALGALLVTELVLRFRFLRPFYSNQGTLPLDLLLDRVDDVYKTVCGLHCRFGEEWQQQVLLSVQVVAAVCLTMGLYTKIMSVVSWYLYLSLTLRNTWMNYILDRYFHYLLFLSMLLPLDAAYAARSSKSKPPHHDNNHTIVIGWYVSPATIALKCLVVWIYLNMILMVL